MAEDEWQSVRKSVSFVWISDLIDEVDLKWAKWPDEVPIWDYARGFPVGVNLAWTKTRFVPKSTPLAEIVDNPSWQRTSPEEAEITNRSFDVEKEREIMPFIRKTLRDDAWQPKPAPKVGYPRLVWANPFERGNMGSPDSRKILNDLGGLVRNRANEFDFEVCELIKNEILALCSKYGLLNAEDDLLGNTYDAWLYQSYLVQAHTETLDFIQWWGFEKLRDYLRDKDEQWIRDLGTKNGYVNGRASPYRFLEFRLDTTSRETSKDSNEEEQRFKEEVIRTAYQAFSYNARFTIDPNLGQVAQAPIANWVQLQLAQMWSGIGTLKVCEGCGRIYVSYRKNTLVCHSRCRGRKKYKVDKYTQDTPTDIL